MATLRDPSLTELTAPAATDRILVSDTGEATYKDKWMALAKLAIVSLANTFAALQTFSAGLTFGQDTLSYYDEGTWTPANPQVTLTNVVGTYTRVGRRVDFEFRVIWPTTADTTDAVISGLPFVPGSPGGLTSSVFGGQIVYDLNASGARFFVVSSTSSALSIKDAALAAITNATLSGKQLRGFGSYYV